MPGYRGDPRWITTRHPGECAECKSELSRGKRAYYLPRNRTIFCETCGERRAAAFNAEVWDEENNTCL
jgi:hypothetical protein